jgi:quercetin dioxygenase-like cupin family protein
LLTVVEGRLELTMAGKPVSVDPGDEVFIPRDVLHSVRNIHHGTTRWLFGYD